MRTIITITIFFLILISGCSSTPIKIGQIRIKGSETMLSLVKDLANEFMKSNPGITIYVEGGGTVVGVKALYDGSADISTGSRIFLPEESKLLAEKFGSTGISTFVARDAICIVVNKNNPINNLTIEQIKLIYTGKIKNWKEVGGNDSPIIKIRRDYNSGTTQHLITRVLDEEPFDKDVIVKSTIKELQQEIANKQNSIGYCGLDHHPLTKLVSINGVYPRKEYIRDGRYIFSRYLYFHTITPPQGIIKDFIEWVLSPAGQALIEKHEFIPLFEISY